MRSIEASGKTVKDAIRNGLAELGCDSDDVDIQVIEMGSPGLFGMFGKPAKVRLTVKAEDPALDIEMPVLSLDANSGKKPKAEKRKAEKPAPKAEKAEKVERTEAPAAPGLLVGDQQETLFLSVLRRRLQHTVGGVHRFLKSHADPVRFEVVFDAIRRAEHIALVEPVSHLGPCADGVAVFRQGDRRLADRVAADAEFFGNVGPGNVFAVVRRQLFEEIVFYS